MQHYSNLRRGTLKGASHHWDHFLHEARGREIGAHYDEMHVVHHAMRVPNLDDVLSCSQHTLRKFFKMLSVRTIAFVFMRGLRWASLEEMAMRVMVFGKAIDGGQAGTPPTEAAFAAMDQFIEELVKAGIMVAGAGLQNSAQAKRLLSDGSGIAVMDGPCAETPELVVGFMIWQVKDIEEAVVWAKRNPMLGVSGVEIRPFYEAADLAEFVASEELTAARDGERGTLGVA